VKIEWSPAARASARQYMADQYGMRAIGAAVVRLADSPYPPDGFHRGDYHRLRVGQYRVARAPIRTRSRRRPGRGPVVGVARRKPSSMTSSFVTRSWNGLEGEQGTE
jgi:hypothetical protein